MKLAIDSYCYHRYFGEIYPGLQEPADRTMTVWDFLKQARRHGVEGVSIESCFLPPIDESFLKRLRDTLDELGFDRVWAWGHPQGLCSGTDRAAAKDLVRHLGYAKQIRAKVMRIVGGSRRTRPKSWAVHKRRLRKMLGSLVGAAEHHGVVMAMENHIDLLADEMVQVMNAVGSPWLGVCLDTANNVRMFEDPLVVAQALAPWTRATHIKDVGTLRGSPQDFSFWPSVPLGKGAVDIAGVLRLLREAKYQGLLAIEVDFLHPSYGPEDRAVASSVKYLRSLLESTGA
jgi:sugar phosphate isomerase/epimerase